MAYIYKGAGWKRALLSLSSVPITILMSWRREHRALPETAAGRQHQG
jgi:hypothetical protein